MANDRIAHAPIEVIVTPTSGKARTAQSPIEVVVSPTSATARVAQAVIEVVVSLTPIAVVGGTRSQAVIVG